VLTEALDWLLNPLAGLRPAVMFINAFISFALIFGGVITLIRTILSVR
jgi:hypothetical protein